MRMCGAHDVSGGMQADHHLTELMLRAPLEREAVCSGPYRDRIKSAVRGVHT